MSWKILLAGLGIVAVAVYYFYDPASAGFFPPCPFKRLTSLDCPGCGSQRAFHALLHLRLGDAFRFNPLALTATPFLLYDGITGKGLLRHPRAPWVVLVIVIAYWILRNLL
ncbi:MAG TPA: DUF2752 domain-containing protein [Anseongella sp.]